MEVERGEGSRSAPLGKRAGAPDSRLRRISPAPADHCQRDLIVLLTPHPASSHEVAQSPRGRSPLGIRQLPSPDPARSPGCPSPAGRANLPSRGPPARKPRGPQARGPLTTPPSDPTAGPPPHLSAGQSQSPDLLRSSRLRKPPPGHPPRAGGGYGGGGCDPNGPLHAQSRAAGGRGASHAGAGTQGRAGCLARGPRSPRTEPREPGTRDSREGNWGGRGGGEAEPPGRVPATLRQGARARNRRARGQRAAREEREEGTGPQRPQRPAGPRPAGGCARSLPDQRRGRGEWAVPICGEGGGALCRTFSSSASCLLCWKAAPGRLNMVSALV